MNKTEKSDISDAIRHEPLYCDAIANSHPPEYVNIHTLI